MDLTSRELLVAALAKLACAWPGGREAAGAGGEPEGAEPAATQAALLAMLLRPRLAEAEATSARLSGACVAGRLPAARGQHPLLVYARI